MMTQHVLPAMRRSRQQLDEGTCRAVLARGTSGVLSLKDEVYPYSTPISYATDGDVIYFHGAVVGHKLDVLEHDPHASFVVIDQDLVVPEKFTTYFRSVVCYGTVRKVEDDAEKRRGIELIGHKYSPEVPEELLQEEISGAWNRMVVLAMDIDAMSGKEAIELVRERAKSV